MVGALALECRCQTIIEPVVLDRAAIINPSSVCTGVPKTNT